jgi:Ca2+-binding RTX toxin-like protein
LYGANGSGHDFERRGVLRGLRLLIALAAALVATAAFGATGAWAVTVQVSSGDLRVDALSGETNTISVTDGGTFWVVTDSTAPVAVPAFDQCTLVGAEAHCPKADVTDMLVVNARNGDDRVVNDTALESDMRGGTGDDEMYGGTGHDLIDPDDGTDFVAGRDGDDTIHTQSSTPPAHPDRVDCGAGTDTAFFDDADVVDPNCEIRNNVGPPPPETDRTTCHFTKIGTPGDNRIRGTRWGDNLYGIGGNDTLLGRGRNDCLYGGRGNDRLVGSRGRDRLFGNSGRDALIGGSRRDVFNAGRGRDVVRAVDGTRELVRCGSGRDTAYVNRGDRTRSCERVIRR